MNQYKIEKRAFADETIRRVAYLAQPVRIHIESDIVSYLQMACADGSAMLIGASHGQSGDCGVIADDRKRLFAVPVGILFYPRSQCGEQVREAAKTLYYNGANARKNITGPREVAQSPNASV